MSLANLIPTAADWFRGGDWIDVEMTTSMPTSAAPLPSAEILIRLTELVNDPNTSGFTKKWALDWLRGFDESSAPSLT